MLLFWYVDESPFLVDGQAIRDFRERLLERMDGVEVVRALLDVKRARCNLRSERYESARKQAAAASPQ